MESLNRSHYCGKLRKEHAQKEVTLVGFADTVRKLGGLTFIDLRDCSGIVQLIEENPEAFPDVRSEYVIKAVGMVRLKKVPNPKLETGDVEVVLSSIEVLSKAKTTPFIIADKSDALEDTRLNYRYLDLRRPVLQKNLRTRAKIMKSVREYFDDNGFTEIETPCMGLSSPEGATEYLVPSRVHKGSFYALDQSPQQYKQLLMIAGMERYYQIARCFRDEDLRADRQPEFTQIDVECSYLSQDEILTLIEGLYKKVMKDIKGIDLKTPFDRVTYYEAMDRYGTDKPDRRYGMELFDCSSVLSGLGFMNVPGAHIRGILIKGYAKTLSRKKMDELNAEAQKFNLKSYVFFKYENKELTGSFVKFLDDVKKKELLELAHLEEGDVLAIGYSLSRRDACYALGALRVKLANELGLIKPETYDFHWIIDFPMFQKKEGEEGYVAEHHPFTRPRDEDLPLLDSDPTKVLAYAYDIVINGYEDGSGTLRIYDGDTQAEIFKVLGLSQEEAERKFGWFLRAFSYGVPPHGGIGLGLDRLSMILCGTDNIRDVIAFPKNLQATDMMNKAPQPVGAKQLDLLGLAIKE